MNLLQSFPPRTPLYSIDPIKPDITQIESFHHYIFRLATAHCLNVRSFLFWCVAKGQGAQPLFLMHNGHAAAFSTQEMLVRKLETLTKRDNLQEMTLIYFKEVLKDHNLYRAHQAWCPICLSEKNKPIYERLSWTLKGITTCIKHEQVLAERCQVCQKKLIQFKIYGYCSYCQSDLSSIKLTNQASLLELHNTAELILNLFKTPRQKEIPVENSITCLMDTHQLNANSLSKVASLSAFSLNKKERKKPSLDTLITLSHYFKYPLYKLLDKRLI